MVQTYTADCFAPGHSGQTDMQNIEDNFAALLSSFAGASAPANPVGGRWFVNTTTHILYIRNEANTAELAIWDMANNKPVLTNILVTDIPAAMKDAAAGTASLRTLGTGAAQACAGNDARLNVDAAAATGSLRTLGTGALQACAGNDSRLSGGLGVGQTWQDVTLSRSDGVTYYNPSSTKSMAVSLRVIGGSITVAGITVAASNSGNEQCTLFAIVPPSASYVLNGKIGAYILS